MKKSPTVAFLLSFLLPGAGLCYLGKWRWGFVNLAVVFSIGLAAALLMPDQLFDQYAKYIGIGCSSGSGALAQAIAQQLNARRPSNDKPNDKS